MTDNTRHNSRPLAERARPATLDGVVGQWEAVKRLREFAHEWDSGKKPAVRCALLEGPTGTGKTAAALALAHDMGWGIVEMSAADARNADALAEVAGRASITNSFTDDGRFLSSAAGGRTLVLLDEVDALPVSGSGRSRSSGNDRAVSFRDFLSDRYKAIAELNKGWGLSGRDAYESFDELPKEPSTGGLARYPKAARMDIADWSETRSKRRSVTDEGAPDALGDLIANTKQPLILTANDAYPLFRAGVLSKQSVARIRFMPVDRQSLRTLLNRIALSEHIAIAPGSVDAVVQRSRGDVRAALNDVEAIAGMSSETDPAEVLGIREAESNLFEATKHFLSSGRFVPSVEVMTLVDAPPEDLLPWIEENLPRFATDPEGIRAGFDVLSHADMLIVRANRWRIWGLWSYASELLTGGVSVAIRHGEHPENRHGFPRVEFPSIFMDIKVSSGRRWTRDALSRKIGQHVHMSRKRAAEEMLPFLGRIFGERGGIEDERMQGLAEFQLQLSRDLGLTPAEIAFLLDRPREHPSVRRLAKESTSATRGTTL